ncbi:hypothetical protein L3Q82_013758, partial [Scortum barcoo]
SPVHTRTVRRWTQEAAEALQDCFESTDWDVLCEPHGEDIDNMTDCITEYIRFCEDTTVPARTVHCFSNNKPWITRDLKALLNKKKMAFRAGDREEQRRVQHELRDMLRTCKDNYRRKLEAKLQQNNVRDVWTGMKHITGMKGKDRQTPGSLDRANQFNQFFNRFSSPPASPPTTPPWPPTHPHCQVKRQLERLHQRKAAGPDGITPRILKTCASQLSGPQEVEAIRPGRLQTSCPHISCDEGVDDAVIYLLQRAHMHLDGGGGTVRITFFDFSSAFNTIQPLLLGEKLQVMGVDDSMISWITDYLTGRPQFVRLGSVLSDVVKFSDDSAVVGCIREGEEGGRRCLHSHYGSGGRMVEEVEDYKYLGVVIDNRLDWKSNTEAVYKKGMSRLYFLRKLRSFQ